MGMRTGMELHWQDCVKWQVRCQAKEPNVRCIAKHTDYPYCSAVCAELDEWHRQPRPSEQITFGFDMAG